MTKGAVAEAITDLKAVVRWADGEYPADCHSNVERYHWLAVFIISFYEILDYI